MNKELLEEVLKQVYKDEIKNLKELIEDDADEQFTLGAGFGMKFMMKAVSDCLDADEMIKEILQ